MAPKKAAVETQPSEPSPAEEKAKKPDATAVRKLAAHPSTAIMVKEAIKALDSRKGVSSQAIQNYIKQTYPSVDLGRLKGLVRKALKKGLETGTLVRPANAAEARGAIGRFRLAKKDPKAKSENVDPNVQKIPKTAKEEPKKKKPAATTKAGKDKSPEEPKPDKKTKKDEDTSSKVAPVKKPKAAKKVVPTGAEGSETLKPKGKAKGEKAEKAGKAQKAKGTAKSDEAPAKAPGKRKNAD